jgi:hypothetical protein
VSCELSWRLPVALYLPTITVPPLPFDVCDAETIRLSPNNAVATKCPVVEVE